MAIRRKEVARRSEIVARTGKVRVSDRNYRCHSIAVRFSAREVAAMQKVCDELAAANEPSSFSDVIRRAVEVYCARVDD